MGQGRRALQWERAWSLPGRPTWRSTLRTGAWGGVGFEMRPDSQRGSHGVEATVEADTMGICGGSTQEVT
jgi:hypothetical protein